MEASITTIIKVKMKESLHTSTKYRPDIDGLRAIAVLLVVLNHAGFSAFSGGFIGVDVFFVISGYLITTIIYKQMERGSFSFINFYVRRARRILPALYVLLLAVMVVGYYIQIPSDYSVLSESSLSSIAFSSNIFFWLNSGGYFSANAEEMPLLHIWSLSVEEQFYFLWPIALFLLIKIKSKIIFISIVTTIAIASFAVAEVGIAKNFAGTYFLLPFRAGELLIGALLALWLSKRQPIKNNTQASSIFSICGILMVIIPSVYLSGTSSFPGINALIPCLGAALVIWSGALGNTIVSRILSTRPFVFVGLISYSVYLWHWPVISFLKYTRVEITTEIAILIVIGSIVAGYLSWLLVEKPFRKYNSQPMTKSIVRITVTATLLTAIFPAVVYVKDGLPSRFPYAMMTQDELTLERARYWDGIATKDTKFDGEKSTKKVVVIGNSHAYDFSYALTENGFNGQIKLIETSFYCFNFSYNYVLAIKREECKKELFKALSTPELKTAEAIYLHDNWGGKNLQGLEEMIAMIRNVNKAPIYVIGPKMIFTDSALNISKEAQLSRHVTPDSINEFAKRFEDKERFVYDDELKEFFKNKNLPGVKYISALDSQCGVDHKCDILANNGDYLYFDAGHFTLKGSKVFGEILKKNAEFLFN